MSSLVSLNHVRRKSADARLQRSLSHAPSDAPVASPRAGTTSQEVAAIERKSRAEAGIPEVHIRTPRRRVKSAIETRKEQEASDIFLQQERPPVNHVDPKWGTTKYSEDFGPKPLVSQVPARPASSTRRNNPHPSHSFMTWQYPVRIHKHKRAVQPHPETRRFINEGFYDDYTEDYNTGDAKNEVPITNVATIEFPGKKQFPTGGRSKPRVFSGVTGKKAHLVQRHGEASTESKRNFRPPSPQTRMIWGTVKGGTLPVVKEWLKVASTKERELLLHMLQAGYDNSEDVRLSKALGDVLQPNSSEKVHEWLQNASESERQMILHVLETLAIAADENGMAPGMGGDKYPFASNQNFPGNYLTNHYRGYSYPITLRPRKSAHHGTQSKSYRGQYSKYHDHSSSQYGRPSEDSRASQSSVFDGRSMGLHGTKMKIQSSREGKGPSHCLQSSSKDLNPEIWHNRILEKHTGASHFHADGIFSLPMKDRGQHYSHHPEWPTA